MSVTLEERPPTVRQRPSASRSLFDPTIVRGALVDSLRKLNPRTMVRNPVMFVVEIGSVLTTVLLFRDLGSNSHKDNVFTIVVARLSCAIARANSARGRRSGANRFKNPKS